MEKEQKEKQLVFMKAADKYSCIFKNSRHF